MITLIGNLKGGTGKSTVAFNLAVWLQTSGKEVRLFDFDPQKTLTDVVDVRLDEGYEPQLKVIDSVAELRAVAEQDNNVEVLVDVGVSDMEALTTAIALADRIVVPVQPSQADVWSTQRFLSIVRKHVTDKKPPLLGFINRADTHHQVRETEESEEALQSLPGLTHLPLRLYQRTAFRRSFSEGLAVFELGPSSKAAWEVMKLAKYLYPQ
ncbi:MAG: AAA family ATPase [Gammaproteobacteria bacterium]|nr:AAA family ATPase [Gammaproteobacteria bacterium]